MDYAGDGRLAVKNIEGQARARDEGEYRWGNEQTLLRYAL